MDNCKHVKKKDGTVLKIITTEIEVNIAAAKDELKGQIRREREQIKASKARIDRLKIELQQLEEIES